MLRIARMLSLFLALAIAAFASDVFAGDWQAGVARTNITPTKSMWLSGYGARDHPSEGKLIDLWAKALAIVDPEGHRAIIVTMDLVGIDRDLSQRVCQQIAAKCDYERAQIALCSSHTHTGPVVGKNLRLMYFYDGSHQKLVDEYTIDLEKKLVAVAIEASSKLAKAELRWATGKADVAVNRRNNPEAQVPDLRAAGKLRGPVDHDLPVLAVYTKSDAHKENPQEKPPEPLAVLFGYACHATVLASYEWSGDWPGFAQLEIERRHPGVTALFFAGCGGDQNPLPRRSVDLAKKYGAAAADGVDAVLAKPMPPITGGLQCAYRELDLPLAKVPTRDEIVATTMSKNRIDAACAKHLLAQLDRGQAIAATYPYPIQTWRFGAGGMTGAAGAASAGPSLVLLGGEVVVDYSLAIKAQSASPTWIAAYANDVMAYIPSRRILAEGGYEGIGAQSEYGFLSPWSAEVEKLILDEVKRQSR